MHSLALQDGMREYLTTAFARPYPTQEQAIRQAMMHYREVTGQNPLATEPQEGESPESDQHDNELEEEK